MKKFLLMSAATLTISAFGTVMIDTGVMGNSQNAVYAKKYKPNKAVTTDLETGSDWEVGQDIKPGVYNISTTTGSGNLSSDGASEMNIILGTTPDPDMGQLSNYRVILKKGEALEISGIPSVHFEAAQFSKPVKSGQLSAGDYKVGRDIKPGRYTISLVEGSGNISTDDGSLNEILDTDTDMGVTKTTVRLHKGSKLTFDVPTIQLDRR
ncbi:MAG TPA: hypothetical protein IAA20_02475 [Candidatus Enterococcus avicola]|uniref:WxL domain-containing protein n=1 Tax=Candidatus Enterococcus avicola TaxID=2838561 RepID=A0A9D2F658_9ENTE|nr:hypothetical protein [Weissella thailandensis]HIZ52791.1 hypothetical protein [Candidatus Enterococcus avicola]HJA22831.1 hypothetical protein [Candidatus Limosilactobacillus intestinavium]